MTITEFINKYAKNNKLGFNNIINNIFSNSSEDLYYNNYKPKYINTNYKLPRAFHKSLLNSLKFKLYKSIIIDDNTREELWYSNDSLVYVKSNVVYSIISKNNETSSKTIDLLKNYSKSYLYPSNSDKIIAKQYINSFKIFLNQIFDISPDFNSDIHNSALNISKYLSPGQSCYRYSAAVCYILLKLNKKFNLYIGGASDNPDNLIKLVNHVWVECDNTVYNISSRYLYNFGYYLSFNNKEVESMIDDDINQDKVNLDEIKRAELLRKTKGESKDRYNRRLEYKSDIRKIHEFNEKDLIASGHLTFSLIVGKYTVEIKLKDFLGYLIKFKNVYNITKLYYKDITRAVPFIFDLAEISVNCSCPDFKYRFRYWATINQYNASIAQTRPSSKVNPDNTIGSACKHVLAVLSNKHWTYSLTPYISKVLKENPQLIP